jgi:Spy/CpxP family protein refolding chaperone
LKKHETLTHRVAALRLAAAASLIFIAFAAAAAQGPPPGAGAPAVVNPKGDGDVRTNREAMLRSAEVGATKEELNKQRLMAGIEQTKQDFKRIQLVRNDMVDDIVAKKSLDFKKVSERAEEVNKRAVRLKSYLVPPTPEAEKKPDEERHVEYTEAQLNGALVKLCNVIYSFTDNEMFKNPGTLDTQKSLKAGADLMSIIELSDNIKRSADKLGKSPK